MGDVAVTGVGVVAGLLVGYVVGRLRRRRGALHVTVNYDEHDANG